ncbi:ATP-binding cassette domain-containing protein [Bacillaceae bacterium SIJ1]|uniref:ABC transporter ATP-binding protein n=1 Tax=Litoribacterium kuwaitense TaxID=1398745 RepID=UPI0013EABE0C|nr:ABC transporter transmembrane domain-containing protein [Litoribacterium kuwaitense]NGP45414.1 ATP-binding cassette domain-containing protein [Litoribacterium kuwaitense]
MFQVLKRLSWFFKEEKKRYTIALSLLFIVGVIDLVPPRIIGLTVDQMQIGAMDKEKVVLYLFVLLGTTALSYILTYGWMYQLFGGAFLAEKRLRSKLMSHLFKMAPPFFERQRTGDLMARGTNDLKAVSMTAGFGLLTLVDATAFMLAILVAMTIMIDWKLTLAAVLPLPIMAVAIAYLGGKIHTRFTAAQKAFGTLNDRVLESVAGMRVIRAFRKERDDEERFYRMSEDVYEKNVRVAKIEAFFDPLVNIIVGLSYTIGLGYGTYLVLQQELTIGQLITFNIYLGMLIWPMFAIGELINIMQRGNASLARVNETLEEKEDVPDPENPAVVGGDGSIVFNELNFSYPDTDDAQLKEVSLRIGKGETIGIVGKTGSGKSTFVKQLLRFYPNIQGELGFYGAPIAQQAKVSVRARIGYVPQDHILFSASVQENIMFGNPDATEKEFNEAVRLSALEKDLTFLPEGLETMVGEKGVALSGGQKQRISIARALIDDPDVLILDDSLSAVDAKTEALIVENLQQNRTGKTTLITTHRMSAVEHADQIYVFDQGRIVESGTHDELMNGDGWYKEQAVRQKMDTEGVLP